MDRKEQTSRYFQDLRDRICAALEAVDGQARFERKSWERPGGGGGVMSLLRGGRVFEKAGVNWSAVHGTFEPEFAKNMPGASEDPSFYATGISLVIHTANPLVPAVHANFRYLTTAKEWFGGGADLTPYFPFDEDVDAFHGALKSACDKHDADYYPKYKAWCDEYFFLKHRNEPRGVGGIFFDNHWSGDFERDFAFVRECGEAFYQTYPAIAARRADLPFTEEQREHQLYRRGRYVEFNLLYDRGTLFGLRTNGNVEAILMSLPPVVKW
jgi:coproporphyrinogen III oxidase